MKLWTAPRLWPGGECFILGGGPSLKNIDVDRLRGRRVIAVNDAYRLGDWIDVMFFGDDKYLPKSIEKGSKVTHRDLLLNFAGLKITKRREYLGEPGIRVMGYQNETYGISRDPGQLSWNLSSGACAINLAVHFGVKRIVLLGFDMHKGPSGEKGWHTNRVVLDAKSNPYPSFLKPFPRIAADLAKLGVEVVNACPGSALTVWPIADPREMGLTRDAIAEGAPC